MTTIAVPGHLAGHLPGLSLIADLLAVEQLYPGWHIWISDEGRIIAVHSYTRAEQHALEYHLTADQHAGSGVTLDAGSAAGIRAEIADYVVQAARAAA